MNISDFVTINSFKKYLHDKYNDEFIDNIAYRLPNPRNTLYYLVHNPYPFERRNEVINIFHRHGVDLNISSCMISLSYEEITD